MSENNMTPTQIRENRMPVYRKVVKWLWRLLVVGVIGVIALFVGLSFSDLPDTQQLENPKNDFASEIYAANGEELGRFFNENRVPITFDQLSPFVEQALLATEDERFYRHCGVDFEALGRVFFKTMILRQSNAGGGSTITQQLSKLLFTGRRARGFSAAVFQKLKEWIISVQLERKYTKEEIMALYLNKFDFLYDSYGIEAAAETYFGKSQSDLKLEEAAMLIGMLKNPSLFNPRRFPDTTMHRRMVVLKQMQKNNLITQEVYDSLRVLPLDISNFVRKTHTIGIAQYFRMVLRERVKSLLSSGAVKKKPDGSPYNIYTDGLKIHTTIDPVLQKHAEEAMLGHMKQLQEKFDKYWQRRKMSPWKYRDADTTPGEMRARDRKLTWLMRNSERYKNERLKHLKEETIDALKEEVEGLKLRDVDIERMIAEEKKKGSISRLVSNNMINAGMAAQYRKALKSKHWKDLKKQWGDLETAVDESFKTPVEMTVFAYTDKMEKDTTMSPMDSIKYHHNFLQIGSLAVDPKTGYIRSWIGGINQKYFPFDHTTSNRQVGSTFKPFVYATSISKQSTSPCYQVRDLPRTILPSDGKFGLIEPWTPSNSSGDYTGEWMNLKEALRNSVNTVSVHLMKNLESTEPVRELVREMGIKVDQQYPNGTYRVPKQPSICLGATDLSVHEMAGAYTTFANNGNYSPPIFITLIEDKNGTDIYSQSPAPRRALEEDYNYVMVELLRYSGGYMGLKSDTGGKTGTTNDYVDGWFMGITPDLVVGTWVGGEDRWIRFLDITNGQGSRMAKPFFKDFMTRLEADSTADYRVNARFPLPSKPVTIELDCSVYENPNGGDSENPEDPYADEDEDEYGDRDTTILQDLNMNK